MPIVITCVSPELAEHAEQVMAEEAKHNPDLNGANYRVEIGDFDSIDGADEITGSILYGLIFRSQD